MEECADRRHNAVLRETMVAQGIPLVEVTMLVEETNVKGKGESGDKDTGLTDEARILVRVKRYCNKTQQTVVGVIEDD